MSARYVEIREAEMREVLEGCGFNEVRITGTAELVFERLRKDPDFVVRVWTSVTRQAQRGRGVGQDAIRVSVCWKGCPVWSATRTHRTQGWKERMVMRMREAWAVRIQKCPTCKARPMIERETRDKTRRFMGCVGYPECKGTAPIAVQS
jgi:hypothetical protein